MEYIYQIDPATNKRIGKISRKEAHKHGILHETIHCWIVNQKGEVLLQHRSKEKSQYADYYHLSIGGHVEYGDSAKETVLKEAEEELGIEFDKSKLTLLFDMQENVTVPEDGSSDNEYRTIWGYVLTDEKLGYLQTEEVESVLWMDMDEFEKEIRDGDLYSKMLPHSKEYYLKAISKVRELFNNTK